MPQLGLPDKGHALEELVAWDAWTQNQTVFRDKNKPFWCKSTKLDIFFMSYIYIIKAPKIDIKGPFCRNYNYFLKCEKNNHD